MGAESDSLAQPTWHLRSVAICNIAE
ncbi:hypothetical protein J2W92_002396 [Rhizobium leguminosarum]|nr:hypothetical protein [Rhizobium leguminosarum]MBP2488459.1 hypothetical protein [Rhizobium leguminosarum]